MSKELETAHAQAIMESYGRMRRAISRYLNEHLEGEPVNPQQMILMRFLKKHGGASLSEVGRQTQTDTASACRSLAALVKQGFVMSDDDPHDQRRKIFSLSAEGRQLCKKLDSVHAGFSKAVFGALSERDRTSFLRIIEIIGDHVSRQMG